MSISNTLTQSLTHVPGFRFAETMTGEALLGGVRRHMEFRLEARAPSLWDHLRTGHTQIEGEVDLVGVCKAAPLTGSLWIRLLRPSGSTIRYEFAFPGAGGKELRFVGEKRLRLLHLDQTLRTLPGELRGEDDKLLGHAQLRFHLRTLPAFLASFRPLF